MLSGMFSLCEFVDLYLRCKSTVNSINSQVYPATKDLQLVCSPLQNYIAPITLTIQSGLSSCGTALMKCKMILPLAFCLIMTELLNDWMTG